MTRFGVATALAVAAAGLLWATGAGLVFAGDDAAGLVLIAPAATATVLASVHHWLRVDERVFVHGYHVGYHSARLDLACNYPECDVLDLAEERAKRA